MIHNNKIKWFNYSVQITIASCFLEALGYMAAVYLFYCYMYMAVKCLPHYHWRRSETSALLLWHS